MKNFFAFPGLLALATPACAISIVYPDETSFLGAVNPGYYLNDFDDINSELGPETKSIDYALGDFAYTTSSSAGLYAVNPDGNWALSTFDETTVLNVTFKNGNVTAVGGIFSLTDNDGETSPGTVTVNLSDSTSKTFAAGSFRGFTSGGPLITSLSFTSDSTGDDNHYPTLDHFHVGQAPVPDGGTTLVLLGGTLTGLGVLRQKFSA